VRKRQISHLTNINSQLKIKDQYGNVQIENIYAPVNIDAEMTEIKNFCRQFWKNILLTWTAGMVILLYRQNLLKWLQANKEWPVSKIVNDNISLKVQDNLIILLLLKQNNNE